MSKSRKCLVLLEKCTNMKQLKQAHAQIITNGLGNDNFALSRVLAFCSNPHYGSLNHALQIFERIEKPTMCICNTMIKAFLLKGELIKIIKVYTRMLQEGLYPDNYTLPHMLKACKNLQNSVLACGMMEAAARIFDEIPHRTAVSWTIMISGYARQGDIDTARLIFDEAPMKDRGIWGSIISGYVQNNCFKEGLQMFRMMQLTNLEPDEAVFVSVLCACAHLGALDIGIWIHRYLDRIALPLTIRLSTALIDMYARCGNLDIAKKLFDGMQQRDTICWNAMISGVAVHGDGENALKLFLEMEKSGFRPNDITFIAVFTACSYSGMAYEGLHLFKKMSTVYGIEPKSEHYGCIIDFLGRAGLFEEAKEIIQGIPNSSSPYEKAIPWRALLSACCNQRKTQLAEFAAQQLVQLERHSGVYVLLSNMYAAAGNYNDARTVRMMMKKRGIEKTPGCSSIEINGFIHEFIAGEKAHLQMDEIHELLEKMNKHLEYNPN